MHGKVDKNQSAIVKQLQQLGVSVFVLSGVGKGIADLIIGWRGKNYLVEVKNPERKWKYTPDQVRFRASWRGQIVTIEKVEELFNLLGIKG